MSSPAISVKNLSKVYRVWRNSGDMLLEALIGGHRHRDFQALTDISFDVSRGSVLGVIGRNGAGKSTLLRIIANTLDATSGNATVNGRISAILELGTGFHGEYSGRENVYLGGLCLGLTRPEITEKFDEIVSFAELEAFIDQPFRTYSSGMQARLTFAVATCVDPDVLIIDEALSVGDARFQLKCYDRIRSFKERGKSILLVSHSMSSIVAICDRVILLENGRLIANGTANDVSNLYHELLFSPPGAKPSAGTDGTVPAVEALPASELAGDGTRNPAAAAAAGNPELARYLRTALDSANIRERRYGLRHAEIATIRLADIDGRVVSSVESLKEYRIICQIVAHQPMDDLCFGFFVRDSRGVELFGWDMRSAGQYQPLKPFAAGEEREIAVKFRVNLSAGHYFVGVTLAHWDSTKEDVRFDAQDLIVEATPALHTVSLVNLELELDENFRDSAPLPRVLPLGPFERETGYCWTCDLPPLDISSESADHANISTMGVLEENKKLGPAHSSHEVIRKVGRGAYSHWEGRLFVSTSDNSDPNANGRKYVAVVPTLHAASSSGG